MGGTDPNTMQAPGTDPMSAGEEMPETNQEETSDSTVDIINQLTPTDREAVRSYAESMLNRDESNSDQETGTEEPAAEPQGQDNIMMEITKGRLMKMQRRLNEVFNEPEKEKEGERKQEKVARRKKGFKSPFDSPLN